MGLRRKSALKKHVSLDVGLKKTDSAAEDTSKETQPDETAARIVAGEHILSAITKGTPTMPPSTREQPCIESSGACRVEDAKRALGKLEGEVISALFPSSGAPQSFDEIAVALGMTPQEVKEIADNALRGLRGPIRNTPRISRVWN